MKEVVFVVLAIAVAALVVVEVFLGLAGFEGNRGFICKKLFSRKKLKNPLNAKPYCAPLPPEKPKDGNLPQKYGDATAIVFAETAGKAKTTALATENFWGSDFLDVEVHRQPGADQFYTPGKTEMDWCDPQDRINMVKYFGFTCLEHVEECHFCPAKEFCEDRRDV